MQGMPLHRKISNNLPTNREKPGNTGQDALAGKALCHKGYKRIPLERKELRSEPRTEDKHGDQTDSALTEYPPRAAVAQRS